jgi:hypothetical protein
MKMNFLKALPGLFLGVFGGTLTKRKILLRG